MKLRTDEVSSPRRGRVKIARLPVRVGVLFVLLGLPATGQAQVSYSIRGLGAGPSTAAAINSWGTVVGTAKDSQAFVWRRATGVHLLPGNPPSAAFDVNDRGDVLGRQAGAICCDQPMLWLAGGRIVHPEGDSFNGCASYTARSINNDRFVAGSAYDGCDAFGWAYTWRAGQATELTGLGYDAAAFDVDQYGHVVGVSGSYLIADHPHQAFISYLGQTTWLDDLGGLRYSAAIGVSPSGSFIVGSATPEIGVEHAVVWKGSDHAVQDLTPLLGPHGRSVAVAVNDSGDVIGLIERRGVSRAVLWHHGRRYFLANLIPDLDGWSSVAAASINDSGLIAGSAERRGSTRAVIFVPAR